MLRCIIGSLCLLPFANGVIPVPDEISALANLGIAGALVMVIVMLQKEKKEMREANAKSEGVRHDDSIKLNDTLREITRHCAETINKRES